MLSDSTGSWTPVALSADVPPGTVVPAGIPAGPIALWRSASGRLSASADRCPHRGMRLSHGFVRGEALSCIYHGWSYGKDGHCLRIPAHPGLSPPETIRVVTHPVEEAGGVIWVGGGAATRPPQFDGLTPLRSLQVRAGTSAIEAAAGARVDVNGLLEMASNPRTIWLLLAVQERNETLAHVLLDGDGSPLDSIAASRAVEALRRKAEAIEVEGGTP